MSDTPVPGKDLRAPAAPTTDKSNLAMMVTRLEAQVAALKEQVDCLNETDERQDERIQKLEGDLGTLIKSQKDLIEQVKTAQIRSEKADNNHAIRLRAIEKRIGGFGSLLILIQAAIEVWKATHGH